MTEALLLVAIVAVLAAFVGGVLGSNKVHETESRLRADIVALEGRLRASIDSVKKAV